MSPDKIKRCMLPVPYYHVVFTLPAAIANIAYQNKAVIYDLLFKASAETLITISADPKHLGVRVGVLPAARGGWTVGALVQSNFGGILQVLGRNPAGPARGCSAGSILEVDDRAKRSNR